LNDISIKLKSVLG